MTAFCKDYCFMCGRYGFSIRKASKVYQRFEIVNQLDDLISSWNIAPGLFNPVITQNSPKKITRMRWGLVPHWAQDSQLAFKTINARCEDIEIKPTYKTSFKKYRCLVPASGFYEWDKEVKPSMPYWFSVQDEEIISFAGLYDLWADPRTGRILESYTIVTTTANTLVGKVHGRMPVILAKEDENIWLDLDSDILTLKNLFTPFQSQKMSGYRVGYGVNKSGFDSEELIVPIGNLPKQPSLF
ncbi:SOS response-associated peptidase [Candidatus Gottesmanbacteria bacterium]|nr:SOS response-associated peptidase [Candidatus Gottesmanbacteria bacterium]